MNIVLFSHEQAGKAGDVLENCVANCRAGDVAVRISTHRDLVSHLKEKRKPPEALLLLAESRERLEKLLEIRHLLEDCRTLVVVADSLPETLSAAHRIFPRFVTPMAGHYADLCAVIDRMAARFHATTPSKGENPAP